MSKANKLLIKINGLITLNKFPKMDNSHLIDKKELVQLIDDLKKSVLGQCKFKERGEDE